MKEKMKGEMTEIRNRTDISEYEEEMENSLKHRITN